MCNNITTGPVRQPATLTGAGFGGKKRYYMQKFERVIYRNGLKITDEVESFDFEDVKKILHEQFTRDDNVARYEEVKHANGKESVTLKDAGNKIIIQIKTL